MPLTQDEVEDLIHSWELDPRVDTLAAGTELLSSMGTDAPGRTCWRVRRALELPPDHYDELARIAMDARRAR